MAEAQGNGQDESQTGLARFDPSEGELNPVSTSIPPEGPEGSISWTAGEFVAHHKDTRWYLLLGISAVVIAALIWILTRDLVTAIVIIVAAIFLGIVAARKPRELNYTLDSHGLSIENKLIPFHQFRSVAVVKEGAFSSLVFMPLKRFAFLVTVYYDPADEPKIISLLSSHLPAEDRNKDLIDQLMWKIRF